MKKTAISGKRRKRLTVIIAALILIAAGITCILILRGPKDRLAGVKQRGNDYLMSEEYDKAAEEFLIAIGLAPEDPVNYIQLSEAYIGLKEYDSASVYLEEAVKMTGGSSDPESIEQYIALCIELADCYRMDGKEEKRVDVLKEAQEYTRSERITALLKEYYPKPPQSNILEGSYSVEDGLKVIFTGSGTIYYTLDGTNPTLESYLYHDSIMLPIGNHEINAVVFNEYGFPSEINSLTFFVREVDYVVRAKNFTRDKDYEGAIESYSKALISDPFDPEAYRGLAQVYIASEAYDKAVETVLSGQSNIPDDEGLKELAVRLMPQVDASIASGTYISEDEISITLSGGTKIYYTTDGSDPAEDSNEYSEPIILAAGSTAIKAVSQSEYGTFGDMGTFEYTIHYENAVNDDASGQGGGTDTTDDGSANNGNNNGDTDNDETADSGSGNNDAESTGDNTDTQASGLDNQGGILFSDSNVEAVLRKLLGQKDAPITAAMAKEYTGSIDLSGTEVTSFGDLKWFKNMSVLTCRGNDLADADFINSLKAERVIAAYSSIDEISAITNTEVLKDIEHFGIRVASFSIGDMSVIELLGFFGYMNRIMGELNNLEYLDLSDNGLTNISMFSQINNIESVRYLILRDNMIEDISVLADFNMLVYLDVTNNSITDFSPVEHVPTVIGR